MCLWISKHGSKRAIRVSFPVCSQDQSCFWCKSLYRNEAKRFCDQALRSTRYFVYEIPSSPLSTICVQLEKPGQLDRAFSLSYILYTRVRSWFSINSVHPKILTRFGAKNREQIKDGILTSFEKDGKRVKRRVTHRLKTKVRLYEQFKKKWR